MNTISVRVDNDKAKLLDFLSNELDRSRNYLVNQAIDSYLENEAHHIKELLASITEANEGKLVDHDTVMAEMSAIINTAS